MCGLTYISPQMKAFKSQSNANVHTYYIEVISMYIVSDWDLCLQTVCCYRDFLLCKGRTVLEILVMTENKQALLLFLIF